ncbi:TolC family protein [Longimicrobium sp.]|uniref:TolC family protein n=1 Tax=Longimicrobium sp. TaxID=2029185 RepID=UPI002E370274|nr:TolC family protein [Longimicrobium sp.]
MAIGVVAALACAPRAGWAQADTLHLGALQDAAVRCDPRAAQALMQARATELRLQNLDAERLPQLMLRGEATTQSEVASIPIALPGGAEPPRPPRSRIETALEGQYTLWDGGVLARRRELERARLAAIQAQLAAQLYPLRMEVTESFFAAFLLQERVAEVGTLMEDLEARLTVVRAQVRAGAALPGDTAALRAELLGAAQQRAELAADRRAALAVLSQLTETTVDETDVLALPSLDAPLGTDAAPGAHPQYAVFAAERARLEREDALARARTQPQVAAFGQLAYGRPGLAQFREDLHEYWIGGVRVQWRPWDWGTAGRERQVLQVQRQVVDSEEAAFTARLRRDVQDDLQAAGRLRDALATDDRIVALREQVERQARVQLEERAITSAVYVDARTDLQEARLTRQRHRAELARAQARYLTTLGIKIGR